MCDTYEFAKQGPHPGMRDLVDCRIAHHEVDHAISDHIHIQPVTTDDGFIGPIRELLAFPGRLKHRLIAVHPVHATLI